MPISGPSSYPPTVEEFLAHWEAANAAIGAPGIVLEDGTSRASLVGLRDDLEFVRDAVTDLAVDLSLARTDLFMKLTALQARAVEFNARVRGDLSGTSFPGALPEAFSVGQGEAIVRENLRKISRLWEKIVALGSATPPGVTQPFSLSAGYSRATFDADRDALRDAYRALSDADVDLTVARGDRNRVQDAIYPKLKNYRQKVVGYGTAYPVLLASLPALTPPEGHTPEPVTAQAVWDGPGLLAKVTWSASAETDLKEYQVRGVPGETYNSEDETVLATVPAGGVLAVDTGFGLGAPGLTVGFKVYVILRTGNERGSEAVFVTRPG